MINVWKYISLAILVLFLVLGIVGGISYWKVSAENKENLIRWANDVAKLEGMLVESETTYSRKAMLYSNLESENKDLQKMIERRDEEIHTLSQLSFKLKDEYIKVKNAKEKVVVKYRDRVVTRDSDTDSCDANIDTNTDISKDCKKELENLRFKVEFDEQKEYIRVQGFTLTNPPYAELKIKWTKEFILNLVLTKGENGEFRVYLDTSSTPNIIPVDLRLKVDPNVLFGRKWYENIGVFGSALGGKIGIVGSAGIFYDFGKFSLGIGGGIGYNWSGDIGGYLGLNVGWKPFWRKR